MSEDNSSKFLNLGDYRQKRLKDAARLLPIIGAVILLSPLVRFFVDPQDISATIIYFFAVWIGLIIAAFLLSQRLQDSSKVA